MRHKSDAAEAFRRFYAENRATKFPFDVEIVRSDDGGDFLERAFRALCRKYSITQEFTSSSSPQFNNVAERALGLIDAKALAARIQAPTRFLNVELPLSIRYGWGPCRGPAILLTLL